MVNQKVKMTPTEIARLGGYASKRGKVHDPRILATIPGSVPEQAKALGVSRRTISNYRAALRDIRAAEIAD